MNSYCICRGTSKVLASSKSKRNLKGCIWWTRQCLHKDGLDSVFTKILRSNPWQGNVPWPRREGLLWLLEASWEGVILRYHTDSKQMDRQSWQVLRRQGRSWCFTGSRLVDRRLKTRANASSELQGCNVVSWYGSVRQPPLSSTLWENSVLFLVATTATTNIRLWCLTWSV